MYVGTTSGDVLQVSLSAQLFKRAGPHKSRVPKGVIAVASSPSGETVVGGGDGSVSVLEHGTMLQHVRRTTKTTHNSKIDGTQGSPVTLRVWVQQS